MAQLAAHRVEAHRRAAFERLQARGAVGVPEAPLAELAGIEAGSSGHEVRSLWRSRRGCSAPDLTLDRAAAMEGPALRSAVLADPQ
jgi:hypothetical protein